MTTAPEPSDFGIQLDEEYKDLDLTLTQQFELNKMSRMIESASSVSQLKDLSMKLLKAWYVQKAAVAFVMRQKLIEFESTTIQPTDDQQQSRP